MKPCQANVVLDKPPELEDASGCPPQIRLVASEAMRMMTLNIHKQASFSPNLNSTPHMILHYCISLGSNE